MPRSVLDGRRQGRFANLPRRIYLTYKYRGISSVVYQTLIFPLRSDAARPRAASRPRLGERLARRPPLVPQPRASGDGRHPKLPRREAGGAAGGEDPADDRPRSRPDHRGRRRQRPGACRGAAPDRRDRGGGGRAQRRLLDQRQPRAAGRRSAPRRGAAQLRRDPVARLAGVPSIRHGGSRRGRDRRGQAALSRQPDPIRGYGPQLAGARVVRSPLPLQARRLGSGQRRRTNTGRHGRLHVHTTRGARSGGPVR